MPSMARLASCEGCEWGEVSAGSGQRQTAHRDADLRSACGETGARESGGSPPPAHAPERSRPKHQGVDSSDSLPLRHHQQRIDLGFMHPQIGSERQLRQRADRLGERL